MVMVTVTVVHSVVTVVVIPVMTVVAMPHNDNSAAIGMHDPCVATMVIVSIMVVIVKGEGCTRQQGQRYDAYGYKLLHNSPSRLVTFLRPIL